MPSPAFRTAIPFLACTDVDAAIAFYVERLGFEREWTWGDDGDGPTDGGVRRGDVRLFFFRNSEIASRVHGSEIVIDVDPVDAVYAEHVARKAPITSEIENRPWGVREYSVTDPSGYRLRFSGAVPE